MKHKKSSVSVKENYQQSLGEKFPLFFIDRDIDKT